MRLLTKWRSKWAVALGFFLSLSVVPAQAQSPSDLDMVRTVCEVVEWRAERALDSYDIIEETNGAVQSLASDLSFEVSFRFSDMAPYRSRVLVLTNNVCTAPDSSAASEAAGEHRTAIEEIQRSLQASARDNANTLRGAFDTMRVTIGEAMESWGAEARRRNEERVAAEDARLRASGATREAIERAIGDLAARLRGEAADDLVHRAGDIFGPDLGRLDDIRAAFNDQRDRLQALRVAGDAAWPLVWTRIAGERSAIILGNIDRHITKVRNRIEERARDLTPEQRDEQGVTALLHAIEEARGDVETALNAALAARDHEAVRRAIDTFHRRLAEATARKICATALPRLEGHHGEASETLEHLRELTPSTAQIEEAIAAVATLLRDIEQAQSLCSPVTPSLAEVRNALETVRDDTERARLLLDSLVDSLAAESAP